MTESAAKLTVDHPVRVCPERDARCPHGMECPHWIDRYRCDMAASRAAISSSQALDTTGER